MQKNKIESFEAMILLSATGSNTDLVGDDGDNTLDATNVYQAAIGLDGDDMLIGSGGSNLLLGGDGDDVFKVTSGNNIIDGGADNDVLIVSDQTHADCDLIDRGNGLFQLVGSNGSTFLRNVESIQFSDGLFTISELLNGGTGTGSNNAPTIVDPTDPQIVINENTTFVVDVNANDLDGDTLTYSIASVNDYQSFTIDPATGEVSFINPPDFENPLDEAGNGNYEITVVVSDGTDTVEFMLWIDVRDVDESVPAFTKVTEAQTIEVADNGTFVIDIDAAGGTGTLTFSITGGADASQFAIDPATGELTFVNAPDFGNPGDSDGDNDYEPVSYTHLTLPTKA